MLFEVGYKLTSKPAYVWLPMARDVSKRDKKPVVPIQRNDEITTA